jgi:hypothetical protein
MQLGRKLAEGYAVDPEAEESAPPVAEVPIEPRVEVDIPVEPVRA